MSRLLQSFLVLALLFFARLPSSLAVPLVQLQVQVEPGTHAFTCQYTFRLPASDTTSVLRLNLNSQYPLRDLASPHASQLRLIRAYYPYFADTMQQVAVRFPAHFKGAKEVSFTYAGTLDKRYVTADVLVFSGHTNWLPFRPGQEYELVSYTLAVRVPPAYEVRSTVPGRQQRGRWAFRGTTSAIEVTALVASHFQQVASARAPRVAVVKGGSPLLGLDTLLLRRAEGIIGFYNRTLGAQDPIKRFTIFLPGTNSDAFGLLDNSTVITYTGFDVKDREALLILAHEISHKWWGYGSVHDESEWLNESFATYSSLLYLQASGDSAGYRTEFAKRVQAAANTPALIGFDRQNAPYPLFRRVIYSKGTVVLAALHARVGTEKFYAILANTAASKVSTTAGFLALVGRVSGPDTQQWLTTELSR
jgi:hypothetical protein